MTLKASNLAAAQTLVTQLKDTRVFLAYLRGEVEATTSAAATKFGITSLTMEMPGLTHATQFLRIVANTGMDGDAFAEATGKLLENALESRAVALVATLSAMGIDVDD